MDQSQLEKQIGGNQQPSSSSQLLAEALANVSAAMANLVGANGKIAIVKEQQEEEKIEQKMVSFILKMCFLKYSHSV